MVGKGKESCQRERQGEKGKKEDFFNEWVLWLYHQHQYQYQYQRQNQQMESFFLTETFPHNYYTSTTITSPHLLFLCSHSSLSSFFTSNFQVPIFFSFVYFFLYQHLGLGVVLFLINILDLGFSCVWCFLSFLLFKWNIYDLGFSCFWFLSTFWTWGFLVSWVFIDI